MTDATPAHQPDGAQEDAANVAQSHDIPELPHSSNMDVFKLSLKFTLLLLAGLLVLGSGIGFLVAGMPGVWGALLGVFVALVFSGTTIWSMIHTADKSPNYLMAVVLGAWLMKIVFLIIVIAVIRDLDFYNKIVFAIVLLIGAVGSAGLDILAVSKVRQPYVVPVKK